MIDEYLIFKPQFNGSLDKYKDSLNKCTHLIFSNYDDWKLCIKTDNQRNKIYSTQFVGSKFGNVIGSIFFLIKTCWFIKPIELNQKLTHFTMGERFNQPIQLNQNLTQLLVGYNFNQPIELTNKIKYLCLCSNSCNLIDNLPNGVEELKLEYYFNSPMNDLPTSIKTITFNCDEYAHELNCLPISVEYLKLNESYDKKISNIPKGLKKIGCSKNYKFINDFSNLIVKTF